MRPKGRINSGESGTYIDSINMVWGLAVRRSDGNHVQNALPILVKDLSRQLLHLEGAVGIGVFVECGGMQENLLQLGRIHGLDGLGITNDHRHVRRRVVESDAESRRSCRM